MTHLIFKRLYVKPKVRRRKTFYQNPTVVPSCHVHMSSHQQKDVRMLPMPLLKVAFGYQKMFHASFKE
jgi:hypothetical protein